MFKKNEATLKNFMQKNGCKHTSEKILKQVFKETQKRQEGHNSLDLIKRALVLTSEGLGTAEQTIKVGKRKKTTYNGILLVTEKSRFSNTCKKLLGLSEKFTGPFYSRTASLITSVNKSYNNSVIPSQQIAALQILDKKSSLKFRW